MAERLNSEKMSSEKLDSEKLDSEKLDSEKLNSEKLNSEKLNSEKSSQAGEEKELPLEEGFERLEELIEQLEAEDISLEDAFLAYSEGMKLLKICNTQIDRVEKKVLKLAEDGGLEEF